MPAGGSWRAVKGVELDDAGDASLTVRDVNGDQVTRYRVRLVPNPVAKAFTSRPAPTAVSTARVTQMPDAVLAGWRTSRADAGHAPARGVRRPGARRRSR